MVSESRHRESYARGNVANGTASISSDDTAGANADIEELPILSYEEVTKHNKPWDCWMVIHGNVFDVGPILSTHPGGSQILLKYAGMDATYQYDDVGHSLESLRYDIPRECLKGRIQQTRSEEEELKEFGEKDGHSTSNTDDNCDEGIIIGRGQSLDGYLLWNKMYTYLLCVTISFCLCALLCMKLYEHMTSVDYASMNINGAHSFASFSTHQEQVPETDGIPEWAY